MTYPELINEYLDGTLADTERERELFDGLAEHPEWREEMALQLRMEQAMQRDLSMVAVPPATTNAIFSNVHFAPWNERSTLAGSNFTRRTFFGRGSKQLGFLSGFRLPAVALILASAGFLTYSIIHSNLAESPSPTAPRGAALKPGFADSSFTQSRPTQSAALGSSRSVVVATTSVKPKDRVNERSKERTGNEEERIRPTDGRFAEIPSEPVAKYLNIGNFYSVHYLTSKKIIGVFEGGKIFCSEDGGHAWRQQSSGTTTELYGVNFIDTLNGAVVGGHGIVLHTTDAGRHWNTVASGTTANLIAVHYANADTVYACGESGAIIRSTTSGSDWSPQSSGTTSSLFRMQWKNGTEGEIRGERGIALTTRDAGATWNISK